MKKQAEFYRIKGMKWFDSNDSQPVFEDVATGIINMGKALNTNSAIAMVAVQKYQDIAKFRLYLDPEKFADFTPEERAGVIWHELNHILNKHLEEGIDPDKVGMPVTKRRIMAQEIVCNDTVLHHGLNLPHMNPDDPNEGIIYGEKFLGKNCFGMTTKEVYDLLEQEGIGDNSDDQENQDNQDGENSQGGSQGEQGQDGHACGGVHIDDDIDEDELEEILKNMLDGMNNPNGIASGDDNGLDPNSSKTAGMTNSNIRDELIKNGDVKIKWFDFLRLVDPNIVDSMSGSIGRSNMVANWSRKPRGIMAMNSARTPLLPKMVPDGNPRFGNDAIPKILFAVDQSGSIGADDARKARELATTIPSNLAEISFCAFATHCAEMDQNTGQILGNIGDGTNFSEVNKYAKNKYGKDLRNVSIVMFTDGVSSFYSDEYPQFTNKWFWFNISEEYINMNNFKQLVQNSIGYTGASQFPEKNIFAISDITNW